MSRGHSGSRRRNYGPRQRDIRRRPPHAAEPDRGTIEWPRGAAWTDASGGAPELVARNDREEVA